MRPVHPLDSISDQDHLADLEEFPLGSLGSFSSWDDVHENVPEWIRSFTPEMIAQMGSSSGGGAAAARLTGADSSIVGGNYLSHEQMHAIEAILVEGTEQHYKPFCNDMLQQLQDTNSGTGSSSGTELPPKPLSPQAATSVVSVGSSRGSARASADGLQLSWEIPGAVQQDAATQQQLAVWQESDRRGWLGSRKRATSRMGQQVQPMQGGGTTAAAGMRPGSSAEQQQQQAMAAAATAGTGPDVQQPLQQQQLPQEGEQQQQWGQEHKRRTMQKLLDLEDSVIARDGDREEPKPFCETMFQAL
jgi:hypothetical protein